MAIRVLVVDDDDSMCELLQTELSRRKLSVKAVLSAEDALAALASASFDVVLTDVNLVGGSGVDLCSSILERDPHLPVILLTAFGSMESAIRAIRAGAYDFITKPVDADVLALAIDRAAKERALHLEIQRLKGALDESNRFEGMIGTSDTMKQVFAMIERVSDSEATVLIEGESGSGKELVAKALHARSRRRSGPFVAINCAAMPEALLESELFGHTKGAFTDAHGARQGLFQKATGGTLFLDEIGEMPPGVQAKLLRAIQERTVRPVGSDQEVPFDSRILAATHRDLEQEVAEKRFREDLYYRVNVVRIRVPALRARGDDIMLIAQQILVRMQVGRTEQVIGFNSGAVERMREYSWPGNVRELHNCVERAVALASFDRVGIADLPDRVQGFHATVRAAEEVVDPANLLPMEQVERRYIVHVLRALAGNKTATAKALGFDRRTLYRKLGQIEAAASGTPGESAPPIDEEGVALGPE